MTELLAMLLSFNWQSFILFMAAVACLCFVGWIGSLLADEVIHEDDESQIDNEVRNHPKGRKHDRENS